MFGGIERRGPRTPGGFSLVELMVALALGALLSAGLVAVYLQGRAQFLLDDEMARMQESGRYALNLLRRELALAGFVAGSASVRELAPAAAAPACGPAVGWPLDPRYPLALIDDFRGGTTTADGIDLGCLAAGDIRPGTDVLAVKRSAARPSLGGGGYPALRGPVDPEQWYLRVAAGGDRVSWRYPAREGIPGADRQAGAGVVYWAWYANIFFIREFSTTGDRVPALCTERLSRRDMGPVECLVEGVEDLQVEFGIDSDGDGVPDRYRSRPAGGELERARIARVHLLVRSVKAIAGYRNSARYRLGQREVAAPGDGYLRRVFSTAVVIRNRGRR